MAKKHILGPLLEQNLPKVTIFCQYLLLLWLKWHILGPLFEAIVAQSDKKIQNFFQILNFKFFL